MFQDKRANTDKNESHAERNRRSPHCCLCRPRSERIDKWPGLSSKPGHYLSPAAGSTILSGTGRHDLRLRFHFVDHIDLGALHLEETLRIVY